MTRQQAPQASWLDLCQWADASDQPTCLAAAAPRRIDWMEHRIAGKHLQWDTGPSTHAWQSVDVVRGVPTHDNQWVPPKAYQPPVDPGADLEEASANACAQYAHDWEKAKLSGDAVCKWQVITRAAHHLHAGLAGKPAPLGQRRKQAKAVQREEYAPAPPRRLA